MSRDLFVWFIGKLPYHYPPSLRKGSFYDTLLTLSSHTFLPDLTRVEKLSDSEEEKKIVSLWWGWREVLYGDPDKGLKMFTECSRIYFYRVEPFLFLEMYGLFTGDRKIAHSAFQKILKIRGDFVLVKELLKKMGMRRSPVLPFLSRDHWLNIFLGKFRYRLFKIFRFS